MKRTKWMGKSGWMLAIAALTSLCAVSLPAQTFGGSFAAIGIPDGPAGACVPGFPIAVPVVVPPVLGPTFSITVMVGLTHTWYGDVNLTVTGPTGVIVQLMGTLGPPCPGFGDDSNLGDIYTFDDTAPMTLDAAALAYGPAAVIPRGRYIGDAPLAPFLGLPTAGVWMFTLWDQCSVDVGTISYAAVRLNCLPTTYTITQAMAFAPLVLTSAGCPSDNYVHAITLTGTPVAGGWLYGLAMPLGELLGELATGFPFFGLLPAPGGAFVLVVPIPPGLTFSTVGLHFDPGFAVPTFVSPAFTYTTI